MNSHFERVRRDVKRQLNELPFEEQRELLALFLVDSFLDGLVGDEQFFGLVAEMRSLFLQCCRNELPENAYGEQIARQLLSALQVDKT